MTAAQRDRATLLALLAAGFCVRLLGVGLFPNTARPDEIFQNLEPAFNMVYGHGIMTWEWREGLRSPMFPGFLAGLIRLGRLLGMGAPGMLGVIAVVLSALSTGVVAAGFVVGRTAFGWPGALISASVCAFWPDLVHLGPKHLAEIQAGNVLILALLAVHGHTGEPPARDRTFVAGLLLGIVFCIRFHLAPALAIVGAYAVRRSSWRGWAALVMGAAIPVAAMGLIDLAYWGVVFGSVLKNVQVNLTDGVSNEFGTQPVWWYATALIGEWQWAALPVAGCFLLGARHAPLLAVTAVAIVAAHSANAHKEITFIYAALPPAFVVVGLGTAELAQRLIRAAPALPAALVAGAAGVAWLGVDVGVAATPRFRAMLSAHAGELRAQQALWSGPPPCGVLLRAPAAVWYHTGGTSYTGQPMAMYAARSPQAAATLAPAVNAAIGGRDVADGLEGFTREGCWAGWTGEICLARSERTACIPQPGRDLNSVLDLGRMAADPFRAEPDPGGAAHPSR